MKKGIVFAIIALILVSTWVVWPRVKEDRREAAYQAAMAPFKRDLPIGTVGAEVKRRLDSQKISYNVVNIGGNGGWTYEIEIGQEPGGYCVCFLEGVCRS